MQELLVLDPAFVGRLKPAIEAKLHVVQEISPRMIVVEGDPAEIRSASELPGVQPSRDAEPTSLSYNEQLFFDAWRSVAGRARNGRSMA